MFTLYLNTACVQHPPVIRIYGQVIHRPVYKLQMLSKETKEFYMQIGYSEAQVIKAHDYSRTKNIDLFDALQYLQNEKKNDKGKANQSSAHHYAQSSIIPQIKPYQSSPIGFSFLRPLKEIKTADYEILYPKSKNSSKTEMREERNPVGLLNVSNCCYLNSLLQCYFLMGDMVKEILEAEPVLKHQSPTKLKRIKNEFNLLLRFKELFARMALTSRKYIDPSDILKNLVDSVGEKLSYGQEKDLFQINIGIIERLSECLMYTKKYYKPSEQEESRPKEKGSEDIDIQDNQLKRRYSSVLKLDKSPIKKLFYGTKVEYFDKEGNADNAAQNEERISTEFLGIIINPVHHNLYRALHEEFNYEVEFNNRKVMKHTYIREEPQYFFFYINRLSFDKEEKQLLKNEEKFTFDFTIYLDRYLEKYRQNTAINDPLINELLIKKNLLRKQLNHLEILAQKIEECIAHAQELEGWVQKFPPSSEIDRERERLLKEESRVEVELSEIESRQEKYVLAYIFVHRGDAVSGHYWGYGKNADHWYRFDINCRRLRQGEIITDMQKSGGTPYSLLYVKEKYIPNFAYRYHLAKGSSKEFSLIDLGEDPLLDAPFLQFIDRKLEAQLIQENVQMQKQSVMRNNSQIVDKTINEYIGRYNAVNKFRKRAKGGNGSNGSGKCNDLPIYNNFSVYLNSIEQVELSKFTLFEQALLHAGKMPVERLFEKSQSQLLHLLQRKFRSKCRGEYHLKQYALMGKEKEKYLQLEHQYIYGQTEIIWAITVFQAFSDYQEQAEDEANDPQNANKLIQEIVRLIRMRIAYQNRPKAHKYLKQNSPLYISYVNNEVQLLILLKIALDGYKITNIQLLQPYLKGPTIKEVIYLMEDNAEMCSIDDIKHEGGEEEIEAMLTEFYADNLKRQGRSSQLQKRMSESKEGNWLQGSPSKSASDSPLKAHNSQQKMDLPANESRFSLEWRAQSLQKQQPNFNYSQLLMDFLARLKVVIPVYKKLEKEKNLIQKEGLNVKNRKMIVQNASKVDQESLI